MIQPVIIEVHLPAGMAGPDPLDTDVRCFLIPHASGLTLIDTGVDPSAQPITVALTEIGAQWSDVTDVVLTHNHPDHTGGLARVMAQAPGAALWARDAVALPAATAEDGQTIRGLRVVSTPGHTAGHLSLLSESDDALLIGDLAGSADGRLTRSPAPFTADADEAEHSLHKASRLGFTTLYPSHGAPSTKPELLRMLDSR